MAAKERKVHKERPEIAMQYFSLDSISKSGLLLGRNGPRDIPVGSVFTEARCIRWNETSNSHIHPYVGSVIKTALVLRSVHFYRHILDVVPGGHSAGFEVEGDGLLLLMDELRRLQRNEELVLYAERDTSPEHMTAIDDL